MRVCGAGAGTSAGAADGLLPLQTLLLRWTLLVVRTGFVGLLRASGLCEGRYLRYRTRIMFGFT